MPSTELHNGCNFDRFGLPIPLKCMSFFKDSLPRAFKLFWTLDNTILDKSTALTPRVPEPMRMAISSALLKNRGP